MRCWIEPRDGMDNDNDAWKQPFILQASFQEVILALRTMNVQSHKPTEPPSRPWLFSLRAMSG